MTENIPALVSNADRSGFALADFASLAVDKIACGFFLRKDGARGDKPTFLVLRNRNRGEWGFPKGHMERNESLLAAARRECAEECGISLLSTTSAIYGQRYQVGKKTKATLYFAARTATSTVTLSEEHDQAVWLQAAEVLGHLHHSSLQALFAQHCQDLSLDFGLDHGLERPTRDGDAA